MNEFNRDERFVISQMFDYFVEALQQNDYRYTREEWGGECQFFNQLRIS
jgi:hypothetical protein